jgi:ATP-dependent Zn protease
VPFFYQSGSSFVQIYVGMGAKRVRELFALAKKYSPSIVFIDEIDAVGKSRGGIPNDERESTLNQLLTQMDGFEESSGVIVMAATNKIEVLDEALLRSGRFDRHLHIPMPDFADRVEILKIYLKGKNIAMDIEDIAKITVGFSGASLATLINEAAIHSLRRNSVIIEEEDIYEARQKVLLGKKKVIVFNDEEKSIQALYQAAKAMCAYWYEIGFDKISLIDGDIKDIDREIESKSFMLSKIRVYLAGKAATQIVYNEIYSNTPEDLKRARDVAADMIEKYGMGEHFLPQAGDVESILEDSYNEVIRFLEGAKEPLLKIAKELESKERIDYATLKEIMDEFF